MKIAYLSLVMSALFGSLAFAETVSFTNKELAAAFILVRPELNHISVDGRTGTFTPAPALKFFGLNEEKFQIDFTGIINLADIEFNQLNAKTPQIQFQNGDLEMSIPFADQNSVIRSSLGTISIQGVSLTAQLGWQTQTNGVQNLVVQKVSFNGNLTGTGVLKPTFVLNAVKKLMLKYLLQQVSSILQTPNVQESVQTGLLQWAKFYTGTVYHSIVPNSVQFFSDSETSGIRFEVQ